MEKSVILVTGACGQIGSELVASLRMRNIDVIATDIRKSSELDGSFEVLDVLDSQRLASLIDQYGVTQIYHLAAILSANGEKNPVLAWNINMTGLLNILETSVSKGIQKVFYPSTIAVFGLTTPQEMTPQYTVTEPGTIYGISKLAGERWCAWYAKNKGLDVRSLRYPGLISYKTKAGGGTTDYAVDIFFEAVEKQHYNCFLREDTCLPMMYMPDAIRATIELMEAPAENINHQSSYNIAGVSFTPAELTGEIKKHIPDFRVEYSPDFRQLIADSWPHSIDDHMAKMHWGWKPEFTLTEMTADMIRHIKNNL